MTTDFPTASVGSSQAPTAAVEKSQSASNTEIQTLPDALQRSECLRLEVPPTVRAHAWSERMRAMGMDIAGVLHAISASQGAPRQSLIDKWHALAVGGHGTDALAEIITGYIDPLGHAARSMSQGHVMKLDSLTADAVATEVEQWCNITVFNASDKLRKPQ